MRKIKYFDKLVKKYERIYVQISDNLYVSLESGWIGDAMSCVKDAGDDDLRWDQVKFYRIGRYEPDALEAYLLMLKLVKK